MKTYKLSQKTISLLLAVTMLLTLIPGIAYAQEENIISTADELISLAYSTDKTDFSENYRLLNDIDMSDAQDKRLMKAIGSYSGGSDDIAFDGTFDGGGHKIINLSTTGEALFGYIGNTGTVKNLTLENASVHYRQNSSSKYPAALVSLNCGEIQNCFSINSAVVSDYCSPAGGLIGTNFGNVSRCGVYGGSVSFAVSKAGTSHGGFVGNQRGGIIEECFSTAAVEAKKWAGGFAGKIEEGAITDCYALGDVTGTEENGGFAGAFMEGGTLKNVYAANNVSASSGGGIAGGKGFSFASAGVPQNCWYCSDFILPQNSDTFENSPSCAKSANDMKTAEFAAALSDKWAHDDNLNGGYPYLINAAPPVSGENTVSAAIRVMLAAYDKSTYEFYKLAEPFEVTIEKSTVTVRDVLDAVSENGALSFAFGEGGQSGQIVTINGITPKSPDGWMFSVNGISPAVGVSSAIIADGDELLWYVGTPENGYAAPDWDSIGMPADNMTAVNNASELAELAKNPDKWNGDYILSGDIDMSGIEFLPIGNSEKPFTGSFDGNGFKISNLTVAGDKNSQNLGMFGVIRGARLKNITLKNVNITGGSVIGGLAGTAQADEKSESISFISGCRASGSVIALGTSGIRQTDAGGLVGINDSEQNELSGKVYMSVIDSCTAEVDVIGNTGAADISEAGHIGGLAGLNKGTILNSSALGSVTGGNTTGGFTGSNYGGSIYSSCASGNVSGAYTVGGFAGSAGLYSITENCYSTGDVTALGDNGANYGGFAGTVSGKVKNCVSSGTLTPGHSYNGGFAGSFDGCLWSYNDDLRSISSCFGNSVTSGKETIKALGSYIGGTHAPTDTAAANIGVDKKTAEDKIAAMLNNSIAENKLAAEAAKYKSKVFIPSAVQADSDITALIAKLNANTSADSKIAVSYRASGDFIKSSGGGYTLCAKPEQNTSETVTLSLSLDNAEYEQPVSVTLYSSPKQINKDALLRNIAEQYALSGSNYWQTVTASAYSRLSDSVKTPDSVKTGFAARAAEAIAGTDTDTTLAMNIIALRSLGYDPANITMQDGTKINAVKKLAESPSTGNNGDAYRLLAYTVCGYEAADTDTVIDRLLAAQIDGKGWSNNNDDGIDADSTGAALLGLGAYYGSNSSVRHASDGAVEYLASLMQADGNIKSSYKESNYGTNSNTSAICAIGLEALGIDIKSDRRFIKNGVSLFDGIMSFASEDETGFVYEYGSALTNELSTEQAALAIMGAADNENILDFSGMPRAAIDLTNPGSDPAVPSPSPDITAATAAPDAGSDTVLPTAAPAAVPGGGSSKGGSGGTSKSDIAKKTSVYFTLVGDTVHEKKKHTEFSEWIKEIKIETAENSTAREVIENALRDAGYTVKGLENGYISEITTPDGITLGEYSNGPQSGWLYSVNGESPAVGINDYKLKDGDRIKLYYADSWQSVSFPDVRESDWFFDAAQFAAQNGLILGNTDGEFMPDGKLTRAMAVTILGRFEGVTASTADCGFSDVHSSDWFYPYVSWAVNSGIVYGTGEGLFSPNDSITREQLAAILYRYAKSKSMTDETVKADLTVFSDSADISDWAAEAMQWAFLAQLIRGTDNGAAAPKDNATRAQFSVILMRFSDLTAQKGEF